MHQYFKEYDTKKAVMLGAGRWGSAISIYLQSIGFEICLYCNSQKTGEYIKQNNASPYLKGYNFIEAPKIFYDINLALKDQKLVFISIPSPFLEDNLKTITALEPGAVIICVTKGMDYKRLITIPELFGIFFPHTTYLHLGGPCFPPGLLNKGSIAVQTIACSDLDLAIFFQKKISSKKLRLYASEDVKGVSYLGAMKNVFAIAAGILEGKKFNIETNSAIVTRSLKEMLRLSKPIGVGVSSIYGLSGLGDLVLTCYNSQLSQNCRFGKFIGENGSVQKSLKLIGNSVPEGYFTTKSLYEISKKFEIDTPLTKAIYDLLYAGKDLDLLIEQLLQRSLKIE